MQLFIDSADPKEVKTAWDWGIIDGVTTNPSLAAKVGRPYKDIVAEILGLVNGPVSLEVIATDLEGMLSQGRALAKLNQNVVVKIPSTRDGILAVKQLTQDNIKTNVTLVFSLNQALLAAKAGATYASPFIGRIDDISDHGGDQLIKQIRELFNHYQFNTKILAASIRDPDHVKQAALLGADTATIPFKILEQMCAHPLTDKGLKKFLADWQQSGLQLPV